jgi:hypothetical protein
MHVVKNLKYTEQVRLVFGACRNDRPIGLYGLPPEPRFCALAYGDADAANRVGTRRSVTGIVMTVNGTPVVSASRKQLTVKKSTTATSLRVWQQMKPF